MQITSSDQANADSDTERHTLGQDTELSSSEFRTARHSFQLDALHGVATV